MVDLHVHSTCSDGTFTPEELVDYAIQKGLTAFALTDHDTVNGLDRAIRYAEELRQAQAASPVISSRNDAAARLPVSSVPDSDVPRVPEIIPGIELSTEYQGKDIHMVGLFIDYRQPEFAHYLEDFIRSRENAMKKCVRFSESMTLTLLTRHFWRNSPVRLSPGLILQDISSPTAISRA